MQSTSEYACGDSQASGKRTCCVRTGKEPSLSSLSIVGVLGIMRVAECAIFALRSRAFAPSHAGSATHLRSERLNQFPIHIVPGFFLSHISLAFTGSRRPLYKQYSSSQTQKESFQFFHHRSQCHGDLLVSGSSGLLEALWRCNVATSG